MSLQVKYVMRESGFEEYEFFASLDGRYPRGERTCETCIHFLGFIIKFHAFLSTFELETKKNKKPTNRIVLRVCGIFAFVLMK